MSATANDPEQYKSLSTSALLAFAFGLLSPLALVAPFLLVFPLVGVTTALFALAKIAAPNSNLSGATLARYGLTLAVLFGVGAVTRLIVVDALL